MILIKFMKLSKIQKYLKIKHHLDQNILELMYGILINVVEFQLVMMMILKELLKVLMKY